MSNTFQTLLLTEEKRNIWTSTAAAGGGGDSLTSELAGTGGSSHSNCLPVLWRQGLNSSPSRDTQQVAHRLERALAALRDREPQL